MKRVAIMSALLGLALIGSYITWTAEETEERDVLAVAVYSADASSLQKIAWISEKADVTLEHRTDDDGEYTWVTITERKEVKPEPPAPDEDPEISERVSGIDDDSLRQALAGLGRAVKNDQKDP